MPRIYEEFIINDIDSQQVSGGYHTIYGLDGIAKDSASGVVSDVGLQQGAYVVNRQYGDKTVYGARGSATVHTIVSVSPPIVSITDALNNQLTIDAAKAYVMSVNNAPVIRGNNPANYAGYAFLTQSSGNGTGVAFFDLDGNRTNKGNFAIIDSSIIPDSYYRTTTPPFTFDGKNIVMADFPTTLISHATPTISTTPPVTVPFTIFQPNTTPIDIITTNPTQAAAIVQNAVQTGTLITTSQVAPINLAVINPTTTTSQAAISTPVLPAEIAPIAQAGDAASIHIIPQPSSITPVPKPTIVATDINTGVVNNTNPVVDVPVASSVPDVAVDYHTFTPLTDPATAIPIPTQPSSPATTTDVSLQQSPAVPKLEKVVNNPMLYMPYILLGGAAVIGGIVYAFYHKKSKSSKKADDII